MGIVDELVTAFHAVDRSRKLVYWKWGAEMVAGLAASFVLLEELRGKGTKNASLTGTVAEKDGKKG